MSGGTRSNKFSSVVLVVLACCVGYLFWQKSDDSQSTKALGPSTATAPQRNIPETPAANQRIERAIAITDEQSKRISEIERQLPGLIEQAVRNAAKSPDGTVPTADVVSQAVAPIQKELSQFRSELEEFKKGQDETAEPLTVSPGSVPSVDDIFSDDFTVTPSGSVVAKAPNTQAPGQIAEESIEWEHPVGHKMEGSGVSTVADRLDKFSPFNNGAAPSSNQATAAAQQQPNPEPPEPYITLPENTVLLNAVLTSSLIGRVPKGEGEGVVKPFDFHLLIKGKNILANGHTVPEISHAMASGQAVGDRALSCTEGRVTSFTFIFTDGRVFTQSGSFEKPLAKIGDVYGNKCVLGELVGDLNRYLAGQTGLGAISAVARTAQSNEQTLLSGGNGTVVPLISGNATRAYVGAGMSGGADAASKVLEERFKQHYEAFYTPKGQPVNVYLSESINVDYIPQNRKVRYEEKSSSFMGDIVG